MRTSDRAASCRPFCWLDDPVELENSKLYDKLSVLIRENEL